MSDTVWPAYLGVSPHGTVHRVHVEHLVHTRGGTYAHTYTACGLMAQAIYLAEGADVDCQRCLERDAYDALAEVERELAKARRRAA